MFKVIVSIITILLCAISSKLVQCYTAIVGFVFMLLSVLFPSLSKQQYSKCISLDNSELEILQKQITSSSETFPVSIESSFSSHIALDVIESQNQRYQDYMKFKVQMKKKQNKHSSQSVIDQSESSNLHSKSMSAQLSYSNYAQFQELIDNYNNQCSDCENLNNSVDQFQTPITPQKVFNPNDLSYNPLLDFCNNQIQFTECREYAESNAMIEQSICTGNDFLSENNSYPQKLEAEEDLEDEEVDECSTEASFDSQDSNCFIQKCQNYQENTREYQMYSVKKNMPSPDELELRATRMNNHSTDEKIESLNKQVMNEHLHNYFSMEYLYAKRLSIGEKRNVIDYLENFCSRKRCPCLKFKRRYQRVRQVQANKKKLPIIFENLGY